MPVIFLQWFQFEITCMTQRFIKLITSDRSQQVHGTITYYSYTKNTVILLMR